MLGKVSLLQRAKAVQEAERPPPEPFMLEALRAEMVRLAQGEVRSPFPSASFPSARNPKHSDPA